MEQAKNEKLIGALRRSAANAVYSDDSFALNQLAEQLERGEPLGAQSGAALASLTSERDDARQERDAAHSRADRAEQQLEQLKTDDKSKRK